jgi:hypothetical protein
MILFSNKPPCLHFSFSSVNSFSLWNCRFWNLAPGSSFFAEPLSHRYHTWTLVILMCSSHLAFWLFSLHKSGILVGKRQLEIQIMWIGQAIMQSLASWLCSPTALLHNLYTILLLGRWSFCISWLLQIYSFSWSRPSILAFHWITWIHKYSHCNAENSHCQLVVLCVTASNSWLLHTDRMARFWLLCIWMSEVDALSFIYNYVEYLIFISAISLIHTDFFP